MKEYCPYCHKDVTYKIVKRKQEEYRGIKVNIIEEQAVCSLCNNDLFVNDLYNKNLSKLIKAYRDKTDIISPKDIIALREKYNLSQRELTSILGFGKMTINRYENGMLPSKSQSDYIKLLISSNQKFISLVREAYSQKRITAKTYNKVVNTDSINISAKEEINDKLRSYLDGLFRKERDIYNGYQEFNIDKLETIISYIASKVNNLTITSLNKYLWYIDMLSFKTRVIALTGLTYEKDKFGPTIIDKKYDMITMLDDYFDRLDIETEYGNTTKIVSKNNYDIKKISDSELEVIDKVIKKLKNKKVTEISNLSHDELGWKKTKMYEVISFDYAMDLKLL